MGKAESAPPQRLLRGGRRRGWFSGSEDPRVRVIFNGGFLHMRPCIAKLVWFVGARREASLAPG